MKGGAKVVIERHRHAGVFIAKGGKDSDALATRNMDPGHSVYGEKRIAVEVRTNNNRKQRREAQSIVWTAF